MYHLVVTRLLMALIEETGPGVPIPEGGQTATKVAGAEGFEPSALGFGDRCSDQTELRPYGPSESLPGSGASKAPTAAWQWELVATSSRRARVRAAAWRAAAGMVPTPAA